MSRTVEHYGGDGSEWDALVRRSPGWTHCHLFRWRRLIEHCFGHECLSLVVRDGAGVLEGVLPLVRVRSPVFGHFLVSMPFLNYGGPLGSPAAVSALAAHAVELAQGGRVKLLELRSRTPLPLDLPVSHRKITVLLDLPEGDPAVLWNALRSKVRSQIRRPQKEGVAVRFGPDQLEPFYRVFARHMRDLGTPVQSRGLFAAIAETFPDDVTFGCAYLAGEPIAAGCGFRWGEEFEMTWASSLRDYNAIAPNMLLYWCFIERCVAEGVRTFNFGRCTPGGGTHRFKQQWGSRDAPLWWYHDPATSGAATPSPDSPRYAWGPRLWQRLPLSIANLIGPRVVQYIP